MFTSWIAGTALTSIAAESDEPLRRANGRGAESSSVSTQSLIEEMGDLRRLTRIAATPYITRQCSSYDRKSTSPADANTWFANDDWAQFIRTEQREGRKEYVMMDVDGPGAIVRIWSADPKGTLRIYLDNDAHPVIEKKMKSLLGGEVPGLGKPLAGEYSRGYTLYFPLPYARHAKVTTDDNDTFYHINYRTYPPGTDVHTFSFEEIGGLSALIDRTTRQLAASRSAGAPPPSIKRTAFSTVIPAGGERTVARLKGQKSVREFWTTVTAGDVPAACRATVLKISFDGENTVEAPIGDFFGTAPGPAVFESLPMGVTGDQPPHFWCHWWMPFREQAIFTVRNFDESQITLSGELAEADYDWDDRSLYFHARWRIERDLPTRPWTDWTHLACTGQGRFVGGMLHIVNYSRPWWGEGDEKIYVDGEVFPSHIGTGTEDYYGYAWCSDQKFTHAYHNQTRCDGPWNYGDTSVNRWHIIDDIPFTKSFRFDMENWASDEKSKTTRAAISYWYARPGGNDFFKPITAADCILIHAPPYRVLRVPGGQEGEDLKIISKTGVTERQPLGGQEEFSKEFILWWHEGKPGDQLVLAFNSDKEGDSNVTVGLARAIDYAQIRLYVNDRPSEKVIDLYHDGIEPTGPIDLGVFQIKKGENRLKIELVGANEAAIKHYMCGLEYVLLK